MPKKKIKTKTKRNKYIYISRQENKGEYIECVK